MLNKTFRYKSYVCHGRTTPGRRRAYEANWAKVGLCREGGLLDLTEVFGRTAPRFLEIGFGGGESLIELARSSPENDFIGIETHKPGIGALCLGIETHALTNVRIFHGDAVDILEKCIPAATFSGIQIFFPDPWPKRRHQPRRLIQPEFIRLLASRLLPGGTLHFATDWEDYARHADQVFSQQKPWRYFSDARSPRRPVQTKFESRAITEGRKVWDFQFIIDNKE